MSKKIKRHVQVAIEKYKELIDSCQLNGDTTVDTCISLGISRNSLQRRFKEKYGFTVRDYKLKVNMERACQMLKNGYSVKEIAITLHYENSSNFIAAFKNYHGHTPTELDL